MHWHWQPIDGWPQVLNRHIVCRDSCYIAVVKPGRASPIQPGHPDRRIARLNESRIPACANHNDVAGANSNALRSGDLVKFVSTYGAIGVYIVRAPVPSNIQENTRDEIPFMSTLSILQR